MYNRHFQDYLGNQDSLIFQVMLNIFGLNNGYIAKISIVLSYDMVDANCTLRITVLGLHLTTHQLHRVQSNVCRLSWYAEHSVDCE